MNRLYQAHHSNQGSLLFRTHTYQFSPQSHIHDHNLHCSNRSIPRRNLRLAKNTAFVRLVVDNVLKPVVKMFMTFLQLASLVDTLTSMSNLACVSTLTILALNTHFWPDTHEI